MTQYYQELLNAASSLLDWIWQVLNSNFLIALAGAFAGAYGATWIVAKNERKRRLLEEIRNTNAAIMVASTIIEQFLALKAQNVKDLKDTFDNQKNDYEIFQSKKKAGLIPPQQINEFLLHFQTILPQQVPMETLKTLLFEKISLTGRSLSLMIVLSRCIDALNAGLELRNEITAKCKANLYSPDELAAIYFGLPNTNGNIDRSYPDCVDEISAKTDDIIFFSKLLAEDLNRHGQEFVKSIRKNAPKIHNVDFSKAEQNGLIPDTELYKDWMNMPGPGSGAKPEMRRE